MRKVLITGGAGFIGSWVVRHLMEAADTFVINVDKLTYAADPEAGAFEAKRRNYEFEHIDICDAASIGALLKRFAPDAIMHLAAESHVDRSIDDAGTFIQTNVVGTYTLLDAARCYWSGLEPDRRARFRFHHVSTDEVYVAGRGREIRRDDALPTEFTVFGEQGGVGSSGAGLVQHLWPAGRDHQLLE
jgi:dTDP-glucose 4,6-dehydratase